jgi:hypothetical protein
MGFVSARALANLRQDPDGAEASRSGELTGRDPTPDEIAAERSARRRAEEERDALAAELARATSASGPAESPAASPEAVARFTVAVGEALARGDGHACRLLLYDLAELGRPGWPLVERIAGTSFDGPWGGERTERVLGELEDVFDSGRLRDLALEALENPTEHVPALRSAAASSSRRLGLTPAERARLRAVLASEKDPEVAEGLAATLAASSDLDAPAIVALSSAQESAEVRRALARALAMIPGADAIAALTSIAACDADDRVRRAARVFVLARTPTADGLLVRATRKGSAAEGILLPADIVLSVDGRGARDPDELVHADGPAPRTLALEVLRDGVTINVVATDLAGVDATRVHVPQGRDGE